MVAPVYIPNFWLIDTQDEKIYSVIVLDVEPTPVELVVLVNNLPQTITFDATRHKLAQATIGKQRLLDDLKNFEQVS